MKKKISQTKARLRSVLLTGIMLFANFPGYFFKVLKWMKQIRLNIAAVLMCLITVLSAAPTAAYAAEANLGEVNGADKISVKTSTHYGHQLHYTTIGNWNYPLFCMEYGATSPSSSYLEARKAGASSKTIEAANWIFAGYYMEHGDSIDWLDMAYCQKKVWAILGDNTSWDFSGSGYQAWCANAERNMERLDTLPSFDNTNIGTFYAGTSKTIDDENEVLQDYPEFTFVQNGVTIRHGRYSNSITITVDKACTSTSFRIPNLKYYKELTGDDDELLLYYPYGSSSNQKLIYSAYYDPVSFSLSGTVIPIGNLRINKNAEDGIREGHTFRVQGDNGYDATVTTDKNGVASFTGIPGNSYVTVTEIVDQNSQYAAREPFKLWIPAGETRDFVLGNTLKRGTILVTKIDSETGNNVIASDGVFKVQQWSKAADDFVDYKDLTYDEQQKKYKADELICTADNECLFRVVEVKAPEGYVITNPDGYLFKIYRDGQIVDVNAGKVENDIQKIKVHLEKQGEVLTSFSEEETEYGIKYKPVYEVQSIPDAVYEFRAAEDIVANGSVIYKAGEVVETVTTTAEGADTSELYPGKYVYQEVQAPKGYALDETVYDLELTYSSEEGAVYSVIITAEDERQKLEVSLLKTLEENPYFPNENAYKDIVFGIYAAEDITTGDENLIEEENEAQDNESILLAKDSLVDLITVDETLQGKSSVDFPVNTKWYVKELKTAPEYNLNTDIFEFEFPAPEQTIPLVQIELNDGNAIENKLKRGKIEGLKTDNNGAALEGARIGLFKADESEYTKDTALMTATSDKDGKFVFDNLPVGKYIVKELASPKGYKLDETAYEADINDEGTVVKLTIVNTIIIGRMELYTKLGISPKTGNYINMYTPWILAVTSFLAILLILRKKERNKKCGK